MQLSLAPKMGNCASTIPPPSHIHTPLFQPAKSALLRRGSLHQGPDGSPVLRLTFPSFVATQYNNEVREGKDEMEDGGKRSLRGGRGQDEAVDDGLRMTGNCTTAENPGSLEMRNRVTVNSAT